MVPIVFLLLVIVNLIFLYKMAEKWPCETEEILLRLSKLIPSFEDEKADVKSFLFCISVMAFILILVELAF